MRVIETRRGGRLKLSLGIALGCLLIGAAMSSSSFADTQSHADKNVIDFAASQQNVEKAPAPQPATVAPPTVEKQVEQPAAVQMSASSSVSEQSATASSVQTPVAPMHNNAALRNEKSVVQNAQTNSTENPPLIKNQIAAYSVYGLILALLGAASFVRWKYVTKRRSQLAENENLEVLFTTNYAPLNRVIGLSLLALMPAYVLFYPWDNIWGQVAIASMIAFAGVFLLTTPNDLISYSHKTNSYLISRAVPKASGTPKAAVSDSVPESWRIFFGLVNVIVKFANAIRLSLLNFDRQVYTVIPIDSLTGTSSYQQSELYMRDGNLKHKTEFWVDVFSKHGNWRFLSRSSGKVDALGFRVAQLSNLS